MALIQNSKFKVQKILPRPSGICWRLRLRFFSRYGYAVILTSLPRPSGTPSNRRVISISAFGHLLEAAPPSPPRSAKPKLLWLYTRSFVESNRRENNYQLSIVNYKLLSCQGFQKGLQVCDLGRGKRHSPIVHMMHQRAHVRRIL